MRPLSAERQQFLLPNDSVPGVPIDEPILQGDNIDSIFGEPFLAKGRSRNVVVITSVKGTGGNNNN